MAGRKALVFPGGADVPAEEMSASVDTRREEQVLTSDPQPSGTFPFLPPIENHL